MTQDTELEQTGERQRGEVIEAILANVNRSRELIEQLEEAKQELIALFAQVLPAVYEGWRPQEGERVITVSFGPAPSAKELVVREIRGMVLWATPSSNPGARYRLSLDDDLSTYEVPHYLLPLDFGGELLSAFGIEASRKA
jgi:hypothetical protein